MKIRIFLIIVLIHTLYTLTANSTDINKDNTNLNLSDWEQYQDSLRSEILKHKENKILKKSFLQEIYIRNLTEVHNDSLFVTIPFNVHSNDCGAPDCYTTEVSFSFKLTNILTFPKTIQFYEERYGCFDQYEKFSGVFQLIEQNSKYIIYHSSKYKRTLVLFSSYKEVGTSAYYFTDVNRDSINGKNIYTIRDEYNEDDPQLSYPFTSTILNTPEYEHFLP